MRMPESWNRLMTSPRTVLFPPKMSSPFALGPALDPLIWMIGRPLKFVWVVPSMVTGSVIEGNGEAGLIVYGFVPGILKLITSAPGVLFASMIACRKEPAPESLVFMTVNVAANPESGDIKNWANHSRTTWNGGVK